MSTAGLQEETEVGHRKSELIVQAVFQHENLNFGNWIDCVGIKDEYSKWT